MKRQSTQTSLLSGFFCCAILTLSTGCISPQSDSGSVSSSSFTIGTVTSCPNLGITPGGTTSAPKSSDIAETFYNTDSSWESGTHALWGFETLDAEGAWEKLPSTVNEIIVAVIDTGVDSGHPDLAGHVLNGWNWVANNNNTMDDHGHGTHVSGTIAAQANSIGTVGIAPFVKILPLKVLNSAGSGYTSDVLGAIQCAAENGADVINLSLGSFGSGSDFNSVSSEYNTYISRAVNGYWGKKVAVFAAAGNNSSYVTNTTPANAREAITVGAHKPNGGRCSFSNYGWKLDLLAPGCGNSTSSGVLSLKSSQCRPGSGCPAPVLDGDADSTNDVGRMGGTSMATPHAVGLAALALALKSDLTPAKVEQVLRRALNTSTTGVGDITGKFRYEYGFGLAKAGKDLKTITKDEVLGARFTCPEEGRSPASATQICFRVESNNESYTWKLYDVSGTQNSLELDLSNLGTAIAQGSGNADQNITVNATLGGTNDEHALVLEVTQLSSGVKYYDTLELVP